MEQVIVVKLDGIAYGIDVKLVQEVVYSYVERSLPDSPNFVEGLAYVREQLIPIVKTKRLFGSPFFDLYGNKKVLVLSFAKARGMTNSGYYDTSAVGIVVDDVVGIESYSDMDIKTVPSVYSTTISSEVSGFIERNNTSIAILNVTDFFLDAKGHFKYQKYVNKGTDAEVYKVSKEDLVAAEKAVAGNFPFNNLTKRPILYYLSRLASFEGESIENILSSQPKFFANNAHSQRGTKNLRFFRNPADMYVLMEYIETRIKNAQNKFRIFVFDTAQSAIAESMVLAIEAIRKVKLEYEIVRVSPSLPDEKDQVYTRAELALVTDEIVQKFFQKAGVSIDEYVLHPTYRQKIQEVSSENLDASTLGNPGDLIYAPNVLVSYPERTHEFLSLFSKMLNLGNALILGLFEDIEDFAKPFKKYYIKNRLVFVKE